MSEVPLYCGPPPHLRRRGYICTGLGMSLPPLEVTFSRPVETYPWQICAEEGQLSLYESSGVEVVCIRARKFCSRPRGHLGLDLYRGTSLIRKGPPP